MKPVRKRIYDTEVQKIGKFAVFRHRSTLKTARFSSLHDTYESASAAAVGHVSEAAQKRPEFQHTYYVVEIAAMFSAGPEGLRSEEK